MAHYLENYATKWPLSLATLIKPLLKNVCLQQYSQSMLIWVLYLAMKDEDYHLLESLIKKKTLTGLNKEQMKITPAQFQLMLNKKWKNSAHFLDLCVAMFAGNCKLLQSDNLFKQLQLGHKDVVIKIDHEKNTGFMEKNLKKTIIKLAGVSHFSLDKIGKMVISFSNYTKINLRHRVHAKLLVSTVFLLSFTCVIVTGVLSLMCMLFFICICVIFVM
jgi:hypothetical protein